MNPTALTAQPLVPYAPAHVAKMIVGLIELAEQSIPPETAACFDEGEWHRRVLDELENQLMGIAAPRSRPARVDLSELFIAAQAAQQPRKARSLPLKK